MSENQNRGTIDFAKYDSMATEELEEILRLDAEMPQGQESDTDKILYIMEVLAERKKDNSHTGNTTLEAFESFKQNYMPETDNHIIPMKSKCGCPRWVRSLTATAAILAILITGSVTANAFGFNIWQAAVRWTQETFHFGDWGNTDADDNLPYNSLQEALDKGNVPAWLAPIYIPEEFSLAEINVQNTPIKNIYKAKYISDESKLTITIQDHLEGDPYYAEQSDGLAEEYEVSGITYYLISNQDQNKAVWLYESYECDISGNVPISELKTMIDSIQKG